MLEFPGCFEGFHLSCTKVFHIRRPFLVCQVDLLSWDSSPFARHICGWNLDFFLQPSKSDKWDSCDAIGSGEADIYNNGGVTKNDLYGWSTVPLSNFLSRCVYIKSFLDRFESYPFANCNQQFPITRGAF